MFLKIASRLIIPLAALLSAQAIAQTHDVGRSKSCPIPTMVGEPAICEIKVINEDDFGDSLSVISVHDLVDPGGLALRVPDVGSLPIVFVSEGVSCQSGDGPIGLALPCTIPGIAQPGGSGLFVSFRSEYIVPEGATDPLEDEGDMTVLDACNVNPSGCNPFEQSFQVYAAVSLFEPSLQVTNTGPITAYEGDEITYTIRFEDTSTGTGFPGYENCTGTSTLLGDLGAFQQSTPLDFSYTVQADDPDPLLNTVTITCGLVGFNQTTEGQADHPVDLLGPKINLIFDDGFEN